MEATCNTRLVHWNDYEKWPYVSVCELVCVEGSCILFCDQMHEYIVDITVKREKVAELRERERKKR